MIVLLYSALIYWQFCNIYIVEVDQLLSDGHFLQKEGAVLLFPLPVERHTNYHIIYTNCS